jgi:transposase
LGLLIPHDMNRSLIMPQAVIGCDLSRAFIDLHRLPSGAADRIANTPDAIQSWLGGLDRNMRVVFEATSGCDGDLIAALAACEQPFSRVNPRQAREFARATGVLAKTDRVDARVLAQMGAALDLPTTVPLSPERSRLANFLRRRMQLVDMRKAEKLHRHSAGQPEIATSINAMIELLGRQIVDLDRHIADLIADDTRLAEQARLLTAVPGIGPTVLATRTRHALPTPHRFARRPCSTRPRKRHMARRQTHLGRTPQSSRSPLHRRPERLSPNTGTHRHARQDAHQGQGAQDHPHRRRPTSNSSFSTP